MWSVGCILAELLKRKPFLPGTESKENKMNLLAKIYSQNSARADY